MSSTLQTFAPQSVDRIFAILDALSASTSGIRLSEIARMVDAPKSSIVSLLGGMANTGHVQRGDDGLYRLGPRMYSLAMRVVGSLDLAALARPMLEWLEQQTGETALLGALAPAGDVAIYIDKVESHSPLRYTVSLGQQRDLHSTAIGKLLLAYMPAARLEAYVKNAKLTAFTPATLTTPSSLRKELSAVRARGFASTAGDQVVGASAFAAPVFGFQGEFMAGMVIAGPSERMLANQIHHTSCLLDAARRLCELMANGPQP